MDENNEVVETVENTEAVMVEETAEVSEATEETTESKAVTAEELEEILKAEREKWQKEAEEEKTQAQKLAKMNKEEKLKFERDQLKAELDELRQAKAQAEMTKTARGMLQESGINISDGLLSNLVSEEAEVTKSNVDSFIEDFKAEVDKAVKEALKGKVAKKPASPSGISKEKILAVKDRAERLRLISENQGLFN